MVGSGDVDGPRSKRDFLSSQLRLVVAFAVSVIALSGCGDLASGRQADIARIVEDDLNDPAGYERVGLDLVDPDSGIRKHEGGYVVAWEAVDVPPALVLQDFAQVLRAAGYEIEPDEDTTCTEQSLRLFLVNEGYGMVGSARLEYDIGSSVILRAGWDNRTGETSLRDTLLRDVLPTCGSN